MENRLRLLIGQIRIPSCQLAALQRLGVWGWDGRRLWVSWGGTALPPCGAGGRYGVTFRSSSVGRADGC